MKWFKLIIIILVTLTFAGCNPLNKNSKSGLQVITNGVKSTVFLDGQYLEKAPFINRKIKPGEYTLKIQPDDPSLITYETKIKLHPGLLTVVTWKLAKRPELSGGIIYEMEPIKSKNKSEISFITIPDGAIIALKGKDKDFSPVIMKDISPGHSEFEISLPSYESQKHNINIVAGYRMLVKAKLAKASLDTDKNIDKDNNDTTKSNTEKSNKEEITNKIKNATNSGKLDATESGKLAANKQLKESSNSAVLIKPTNFFQNNQEILRVREKPSPSSKELGFVQVGETYPYLGTAPNGWLNINFNNSSGWVSGVYAKIIKK